jgi:RNA polymerase sigma factor (sigma-70 family)|tara:strand:+ start:107 stop:640 length:534 start_codon:yes stop_codon:yes gene_type:complete
MKNNWHPIEWIYKDFNYYLGFAINKTKDKDLSEDLVQETFVQLMTMNQHKLLIIIDSGKIKTYVCKIMMVKFYSNKSQFNKKMVQYKRKKIESDESFLEHLANKNADDEQGQLHHIEKMNKKIDDCLNTFDEYDRKLFQLYYETGLSIRRLSEETGITFKSIQYTIDKVKKNIKDLI